ncbi:alpha/beta hydrolase family protein [Actinomycetospora atypica]|uniref:Alpha/beta hydrolase family protein n=1 Tax=Actinomycetospora atypica TaxID=1290095 RepID=A0ABV9YJE1_9PSEU
MNTVSRPVVSVAPVLLPGAHREVPVRISAPADGGDLPVVLFAHGFGSSLRGYGPLTDHWAAAGLVVVQPTHLDSRTVGLPAGDPQWSSLWRTRVEDLRTVLDHLEGVEAAVPGLAGRVDRGRVAAAGHSFGGQTAGILLGLRVLDPDTGEGPDLSDPRVSAGVLLATAGRGGDALRPGVAEQLPWLRRPDFSTMTAPALVVAGGADASALTTMGPAWSEDPFHLSPGGRDLVVLPGAEHSLGGIPGYDAAETTDADPARVALLQRLTTGWLRRALGADDEAWRAASADLPDGVLRTRERTGVS